MPHLKASKHQKMKATKVVHKISTYQILSDKHPGSTTFPALKMPLLITPCSTRDPWLRPVCRRLTYSSSDCNDTIEDEVPSPISASQMQNHTHDPHELSFKHDLEAHITWKKKKRISKPFLWMMKIGLPKKFLTDLYVYMNIHCHTDYAHTHVYM